MLDLSVCYIQVRQDVWKSPWEGCFKKSHAVGGLVWADNQSLIQTAKMFQKMSSKGEVCKVFEDKITSSIPACRQLQVHCL